MHVHIPQFMQTAAAFVVVLGVLVFVHEMGHYLAARLVGVHVEAFSIGFGRAIATWTDRLGTHWKLAWLPLGGYVRLHGQERPEEATPEQRATWIEGRTFHDKSVGRRAIVVAAGPIANFLLAIVLFTALFATLGQPIITPRITKITPGGAAAAAGLQVGDRILSIDGRKVDRFDDIYNAVAPHPGAQMPVTVDRQGQVTSVTVRLGSDAAGGEKPIGVLGIGGGQRAEIRLSPAGAVVAGVSETWSVVRQTATALWQILRGHRSADDLGGPLRIAQLSGEAAQLGIASLVNFIAVLSISLGLINLFPIPILDGGHLLFYLAEAIRGRPAPPRAVEYGYRAGFALIASLFIFATWNDLAHLGIFRWVAGLIG